MRLISTVNCLPGMEIAKPIFTDTGTILIGVGVSLTERMIEALKGRNIPLLYIKDKATEDLDIIDDVPLALRVEATTVIHETFSQMQSVNNKRLKAVNYLNVDKL